MYWLINCYARIDITIIDDKTGIFAEFFETKKNNIHGSTKIIRIISHLF